MKKLYLASALATVLTLSSNAMAIDSTGCGLGSMGLERTERYGAADFGGYDQRFFRYPDFRHFFRHFGL